MAPPMSYKSLGSPHSWHAAATATAGPLSTVKATTFVLLLLAFVTMRSSHLDLSAFAGNKPLHQNQGRMEQQLEDEASFRPLDSQALAPLTIEQRGPDQPPLRVRLPTLVRAPKPFFLCSAPKTGCTTWVGFVMYVNYGALIDPQQYRNNPGSVHEQKERLRANESAVDPTSNEHRHLDRIVIARNPYIRFLSSYQDWLSRDEPDRGRITFDQFADLYESRNFTGFARATAMDHIDPVSWTCGMDRLAFSQVYRLEEIPLWYRDFLDRYGMGDHMDRYNANGNSVYEPALDESALVSEYVAEIVGRRPWPGRKLKLRHHHAEFADLVGQYYNPRIASVVTRLFLDDFVRFQYPLWDGNPATFRYV